MGLGRIKVPIPEGADEFDVEPEIAVDRRRELGALHELLLQCCPPNGDGRRSISILAPHIGRSPQSLYKHIARGSLPPWIAQNCSGLTKGRVPLKRFAPYVFRATR